MASTSTEHAPLRRVHWGRLFLLLPFVGVLWVSAYDRVEPALWGIPFFYWYQLLWIPLSAVISFLVYRAES